MHSGVPEGGPGTRNPATTLAEITAAARAHLPGATLRRRLFFRYTLRWDKPPVTAPPPRSGNPRSPVTTERLTGQGQGGDERPPGPGQVPGSAAGFSRPLTGRAITR
jgi:hypothetical protein